MGVVIYLLQVVVVVCAWIGLSAGLFYCWLVVLVISFGGLVLSSGFSVV